MSVNHVIFGGISVLWLLQFISAQLLTVQNLPQWRSVVSVVISIKFFLFKLQNCNLSVFFPCNIYLAVSND